MKEEINLQGLNGIEVWESLYNKELNTKKSILEYIEEVKVLKSGEIDHDQIEMVYNMIYKVFRQWPVILSQIQLCF